MNTQQAPQQQTFQTIEEYINYLLEKTHDLNCRVIRLELINELNRSKLSQKVSQQMPTGEWLNIKELCDYLPDKPAMATVYGWVGHKQIPFRKSGKKLRFLRSEIDKWLLNGNAEKL